MNKGDRVWSARLVIQLVFVGFTYPVEILEQGENLPLIVYGTGQSHLDPPGIWRKRLLPLMENEEDNYGKKETRGPQNEDKPGGTDHFARIP